MATLTESVLVAAPLATTWDHYFEPRGWPAWVDGFASVVSAEDYPEEGGELVWRSNPAGRGTVRERVVEHQPRRTHRIEFSDPESSGTLASAFAVEGEGTRVTLTLEYRLARGGPLAAVTERIFVRGQVRGSLRRTLLRFAHEAREVADPASLADSPRTD